MRLLLCPFTKGCLYYSERQRGEMQKICYISGGIAQTSERGVFCKTAQNPPAKRGRAASAAVLSKYTPMQTLPLPVMNAPRQAGSVPQARQRRGDRGAECGAGVRERVGRVGEEGFPVALGERGEHRVHIAMRAAHPVIGCIGLSRGHKAVRPHGEVGRGKGVGHGREFFPAPTAAHAAAPQQKADIRPNLCAEVGESLWRKGAGKQLV